MGKIIEKRKFRDCKGCGVPLNSYYSIRCIFCAAKNKAAKPEYIKKLSEAKKGKLPKNFVDMQKIGWKKRTGKKLTEKHKQKISESHKGEKSYMWIKDRSKIIQRQERNDSGYCAWRLEVYRRDNFKCRMANLDCKGKIVAHHILSWILYPELRYQINNGSTLCRFHHPLKRVEEKRLVPTFQELVSQIN